jgi:hypothetical protein
MDGDAVAEVAAPLIDKHHEHLQGLHIEYLFKVVEDDEGRMKYPKPNKFGVVVLGKTKCYSEADSAVGCPDFLIVILYNWWEAAEDDKRRALVDHELCHCWVGHDEETGEVQISCAPHEFEGFRAEIERHGPWDSRLQMAQAQLALWDDKHQEALGSKLVDAVERLQAAGAVSISAGGKTVHLGGKGRGKSSEDGA